MLRPTLAQIAKAVIDQASGEVPVVVCASACHESPKGWLWVMKAMLFKFVSHVAQKHLGCTACRGEQDWIVMGHYTT